MNLYSQYSNRKTHGFILLPVAIAIALIATIAYLTSQQSGMGLNRVASEFEATQAEYVAQAGLQHGIRHAAQQGCGPFTNLTNVALGNDQYSTTLTTDLGSTTPYKISVDQDSWIRSDNLTNGNPTDSILHIRFDGGNIERPLYRYDLSSIAAGSAILSATAWFYVTMEHPEGPVDIHRLTADWTEADATWGTMGDNMDHTVLTSIPAQPDKNVWVSVNLTSQVQAWVNGQPNNGIALNSTTEGTLVNYASRENANQPYLEVMVGTPPTPIAALTSVGTLANGTSRTISRNDLVLYQQPPGILQLQPNAVDGKDAEIFDQLHDNNYGDADETWVSSASHDTTRSLLSFNMGAIPAGARILRATLSLRRRSGSGADQPVSAHRISTSWSEGSVTWNRHKSGLNWGTAGGDFDNLAVATTSVGPVNQRYAWNITPLVQGWVNGSYPNYGVILVAAIAGMRGEQFDTSDHADPSRRPSLSISYACACGSPCVAPQGSGKIAMIARSSGLLPDPSDKAKETMLESWGYDVHMYDDNFLWLFDSSNYDAIYISATASDSTLVDQLKYKPIGIVYELEAQNNDLGMATAGASTVGTDITITDSSHYITLPFPAGSMTIKTVATRLSTISGSAAAGAQVLAQTGGLGSLLTLDSGAALGTGVGEFAAARRVMLPVGMSSTDDWSHLNNNGRLIVQRALQWAKPLACSDGEYRDEFDTVAFDNNKGSLSWSGGWIEVDGAGAGADKGNVWITNGQLRLDDRPDTGGEPSAARRFNLEGATAATVSFDFALGSGTEQTEDIAVLEITTDGTNWTELKNFSRWDGGKSGSLTYDLSAYLTADIQIRFRIAAAYGGPNEYLAIDNLSVAVCGTVESGTLPIAHWKLDETTGTTAVDSEGGHDGTLAGNPTWTIGNLKGALDFDGAGDRIDVGSVLDGGAPQISVTAWIFKRDTDDDRVISKSSGTAISDPIFSLGLYGTTIRVRLKTTDNGGISNYDGGSISLNQWVHLAFTYDGGTLRIYNNGTETASYAVTGDMIASPVGITIGNVNATDDRYWNGLLDDIRIYDRALDPSEITDLAASGGGGGRGPSGEVVFEAFTEASRGSNGKSLDIVKPGGTAAGDLLIAAIATDGQQEKGISPPAGWNLINQGMQSDRVTLGVWWKIAGSSEPAQYHFTWPEDEEAYGWVMRFTGHDDINPINVSAKTVGTSNSPTSPAVTTTVPNAMILRIGGFDDDDIDVGKPGLTGHTAITMDESGTGNRSSSGGAGYMTQAGAGNSGTSTFSLTQSEQYRTVTIAIAPDPGG